MSRLYQTEGGTRGTVGETDLNDASGSVAYETSVVRRPEGTSFKFTGQGYAESTSFPPGHLSLLGRIYFRCDASPSSNRLLCAFINDANQYWGAVGITTDRKLRLMYDNGLTV